MMEGRIRFKTLASFNLLILVLLSAFIQFGDYFITETKWLYAFGFVLVLPFTFITTLVFWGSFNRMFNLRQSKRIIGSVDLGTDAASIIAFFSIPVLLTLGIKVEYLFTIALFSISGFFILFIRLGNRHLSNLSSEKEDSKEETHRKLSPFEFLKNKYIVWMSLFIIISMVAMRFVDYSFYNVLTNQFANDSVNLPYFLSYFEATIVIFGFLFTTFATDRLNQDYGLRVSLLITPLLLIAFTAMALGLGYWYGFDAKIVGGSAIFFFIMVAMSKLFITSLRDALDTPTFKFFYVPIDKSIRSIPRPRSKVLSRRLPVPWPGD